MRKARILDNPRLIGGALTIGLGALALVDSSSYDRGSVLRMGPGFFPTALGVVLLGLGGLLLASGLRTAVERIERPEVRSLLCVTLGVTLFAAVLPRFGLAPALALLAPTAACASPSSRPLPTVALTCALIGFAWLVFVELLSLPLPMLSW